MRESSVRNLAYRLCAIVFFLLLTAFLAYTSDLLSTLPDGVTFYDGGSGTATIKDLQTIRDLGYDVTGYRERRSTIQSGTGRSASVTVYDLDESYFLRETLTMETLDTSVPLSAVIGKSVALALYQTYDCIGNLFYVGGVEYTVSAVYDDSVGLWKESAFSRLAGRRQVIFLPLTDESVTLDVIRFNTDLPTGAVQTDVNLVTGNLLNRYLGMRTREEAQFFTPWVMLYLIAAMVWIAVWTVKKIVCLVRNWYGLVKADRYLWCGVCAAAAACIVAGLWILPGIAPTFPEWFSLPSYVLGWSGYESQIFSRLSQHCLVAINVTETRIAAFYVLSSIAITAVSILFWGCAIVLQTIRSENE